LGDEMLKSNAFIALSLLLLATQPKGSASKRRNRKRRRKTKARLKEKSPQARAEFLTLGDGSRVPWSLQMQRELDPAYYHKAIGGDGTIFYTFDEAPPQGFAQMSHQQKLKHASKVFYPFEGIPEVARLKNLEWFQNAIRNTQYDKLGVYNIPIHAINEDPEFIPLIIYMHKSFWPRDVLGVDLGLDNTDPQNLGVLSSPLIKMKEKTLPLTTPYDETIALISPFTTLDHQTIAALITSGQFIPKMQHKVMNKLVGKVMEII
jgi:hypothetical protein